MLTTHKHKIQNNLPFNPPNTFGLVLFLKKKKLDKILINNEDFCENFCRQEKIIPLKIEELQELLTELEYDHQIGEGEDFTEEQMETLLDRPNLIEGVMELSDLFLIKPLRQLS